jgi:DNA-binding GntR family transcriptional regulator
VPAKRAAANLVSRGDPAPLHYQVRRLLLEEIDRGELAPGQKLAPEREYAARFGISLAPVRQAILGLVEEDYLYRVRGSGTFVREAKVEEKIAILSSFTESLRARGFEPDIRTVEQRIVEAPIRVRQALGARQVLSLCRVAVVDGKPVAVLAAYLPADRVSTSTLAAVRSTACWRRGMRSTWRAPRAGSRLDDAGPPTLRSWVSGREHPPCLWKASPTTRPIVLSNSPALCTGPIVFGSESRASDETIKFCT